MKKEGHVYGLKLSIHVRAEVESVIIDSHYDNGIIMKSSRYLKENKRITVHYMREISGNEKKTSWKDKFNGK